jgi:ABC-type multidrug transport system permease subunit
MPAWLRDVGWATPNAWVIESWHGIFWRGEPVAALAAGWGVLLAFALAAMAVTVLLAQRVARAK